MRSVTGQNKYGGCGWCYSRAHKAQDCPNLKHSVGQNSIAAIKYDKRLNGSTGRLCGYCGDENHTSGICPKRFEDSRRTVVSERQIAEKAFEWLKEIGFGPGAMLSGMGRTSSWNSREKGDRIIVIEEFNKITGERFVSELLYGKERNWFPVCAVDTTNETIRNIYLPFHPVFSPKPTSMKVQVIHRSSEEDIEKIKNLLPSLSSPLNDYTDSDDFFSSGYRFENGKSKNPKIIKIHN